MQKQQLQTLGMHSKIQVELSKIMSIVDIRDGIYGDDLCAILVEINEPKVKTQYRGANYLLQVWERQRGKIYEKTLKHVPIGWEICSQFFYMKLDPRDDEGQYWFYEVHLGDIIRESKLRDYAANLEFKYFSCSGNWLYYASSKEIYVIQANQQVAQSGLDLQKIKEANVPHGYIQINRNWVFHGFLCGKALIEDAENNLFFCDVAFDTSVKPYKIKFNENMAVEPRGDVATDNIIKVQTYSRDVNNLHALVLKQSKTVDFYFNGVKIFASASISDPVASKLVFFDIGITSDRIYLRTDKDETYKLSFDGKRRIVFGDAKLSYKIDSSNWNRILHERVKHERIELFFDFKMNKEELYVTYDRFCSSFDLMVKTEFRPETSIINQEGQYLLGVSKDGDTVGLFQEASDPKQAKISTSKVLYMNKTKGLTSSQQLPGRIVSKAEFNHFRVAGWDEGTYGLQTSQYFITEDPEKKRTLLTLWPAANLAPENIGAKVNYQGTKEEGLVQVYAAAKHHSEQESYFGIWDSRAMEVRVFRHKDNGNFQLFQTVKISHGMTKEQVRNLSTIVLPKFTNEHIVLFTSTAIFSVTIASGHAVQKFSSFNLQPYNIQIINTKYLYFQNLEGICLLNLKSIVFQEAAQEILLTKTYNSTNQVQYDPRYDRLLYFVDFETVEIVPLPHKNTVIPYGFNRLSGKFMGETVDACFVTSAADGDIPSIKSEDMFKRLLGVTQSKKVVAWEYPTGQFIEKLDNQLDQIISKEDKFFGNTNVNLKEYGRRFIMYSSPALEEEAKGCQQSQVRGSLHQFKLIKFQNSSQPFLFKKFKLHIMPEDYIHFDLDVNTLLHIQIDFGVCRQAAVFQVQTDKIETNQDSRLVFASMIQRFPWDIYSLCPQSNYIFSPNLAHYITFDPNIQSFIIYKVDKGQKSRNPPRVILEGLFNQEDSEFDPMQVISNFKWENDHTFRVINRDGFEKMVSIAEGEWSILDSTYVPMKKLLNEGPNSMYYHESYKNKISSTFQRLLRKYQKTFTNRQLSIVNKRGTKDNEYLIQRHLSRFYIMFNYSQYHFKMTQALIKVNQASIAERIDIDDLKVLLLSVFPGHNFFLHKVFAKRYRDDIALNEDKLKNFTGVTLKKLFGKLYDQERQEQQFCFPFVQNDRGETPFDLCLPGNIKSADVMLQYLKYQPAGSHSEYIIFSLPKLIEFDLPSLPAYMDSRVIQTRAHTKVTTMQDFDPVSDKNYMLESSHLCPDYHSFFKKFAPKRFRTICGRHIPVERNIILREKEVKVEVLDLPFLHSYNGEGFHHAQGLFRELSNSDHIGIFSSKAVQYLIDFNWQSTKINTILFLFIPFVLFHGAFIAYSNVYNGQFTNPEASFEIGYIVLSALLYFFSLYFLINEAGQLALVGKSYFGWGFVWNAIDILPPVFIIAVVTQRLRQDYEWDELMKPGFIDTVHSVTCLLMWLKFLYFLRLFDSTSHLVRVIFNMFWETKVFVGVLCIFYMAFGEAFLRLAEKGDIPEGEDSFLSNFAEAFVYTLRLGVGDTDVASIYNVNQPITGWILFVVFEILTTILLGSLLITVIMKQYDKISKHAELSNYQQKSKLIFENAYLSQICRCFKFTNFEMERNLMIITDMTNQGLTIKYDASKDPIEMIQETVDSLVEENKELKRLIKKQAKDTASSIEKLVNELKRK